MVWYVYIITNIPEKSQISDKIFLLV